MAGRGGRPRPLLRNRRGGLLIISLWVVVIVATLAVAAARYLSTELRIVRFRAARQDAQALARGGVYTALRQLAEDAGTVDWLGDGWALGFVLPAPPAAVVQVTVTDEERKANLNSATLEQLSALLASPGLAQAILAYRDPGTDPSEDRPRDLPPYYAKHGAVEVLEELAELPDVDAPRWARLATHTTPYTDGAGAAAGPLNINTAPAEVLASLGLSAGAVNAIVRFRDGPDGAEQHAADGIFEEPGMAIVQTLEDRQGFVAEDTDRSLLANAGLFGVSSQTFTIRSQASREEPAVTVWVEAVVRRLSEGEPPEILAWREG